MKNESFNKNNYTPGIRISCLYLHQVLENHLIFVCNIKTESSNKS